jgi:predicted nucleic acid-binding protein
MAYLDTNVIIGYCFPQDKNHTNAKLIIRKLQELGIERFYGSPLTLVEFYSYISRNIDAIELPPELRDLASTKVLKVRIIVEECILELPHPLTFISDTEGLLGVEAMHGIANIKVFHKFAEALKFAPELQIPTLDLLHLIYAKQASDHVEYFATLDTAIIKKAGVIEKVLGIKVINVSPAPSPKP